MKAMIIAVLFSFMVGCASFPQPQTPKQGLAVADETVASLYRQAADLYRNGRINDADRAAILKAGATVDDVLDQAHEYQHLCDTTPVCRADLVNTYLSMAQDGLPKLRAYLVEESRGMN